MMDLVDNLLDTSLLNDKQSTFDLIKFDTMKRQIIYLFFFCLIFGLTNSQAQSLTQNSRNTKLITSSNTIGKYAWYSGIPSMYMGVFILQEDGKYKVALSNDETNYELGTYKFNADTNSIEWLTGLFKNNNWAGKISIPDNKIRIQFNRASYALKQ